MTSTVAKKRRHIRQGIEDSGSLGYVVAKIIGGSSARVGIAAQNLGVPYNTFSEFLHSSRAISRDYIETNKWASKLAEFYPEGWRKHGIVFQQRLELIERNAVQEPQDKESFGHVLFLILGGRNANLAKAQKYLGISRSTLSKIIHNHRNGRDSLFISQQLIVHKNWREAFAEHYPETWKLHAATFEERVKALPVGNAKPRRPSVTKRMLNAWRITAGEVVQEILTEKGGSIKNLSGDPRVVALVLQGNPSLDISAYRDVLNEVCGWSSADKEPTSPYARAQQLLLQYAKS
ncbi:MAG: hypothetical protein WAO98_07940 [Alphaproteobacteria bacterium]